MEPQPASVGLFRRYLEPRTPPDALHPLGIDPPAFGPQQRRNAALAAATVLIGQPDDLRGQRGFVIADLVRFALGERVDQWYGRPGPSKIPRSCGTCITHWRRPSGLGGFPQAPLSESACPKSAQRHT